MSSRRAILLVGRREVQQRVRSRVFALSTLALLLAVVAAVVIPSLRADKPETVKAGLVGRSPAALVPSFVQAAKTADVRFQARQYATLAAGERGLRRGDVGVLVVDGQRLVWKSKIDKGVEAVAVATLQRLRSQRDAVSLGLTQTQAEALLTPAVVAERQLDPPDPDRDARYAAALMGLFVLMWAIMLYGGSVTQGVVQEKSGRVIEVLLSRISARDLLTGKVLGIGLVGLFQLVLALPAAFAAAALVNDAQLPNAVPSMVGWVILWFVLGYAFFSVVFAASAARVTRAEEVQSEQAVIAMIPTFCALFALFYAAQTPDTWLSRLASFVPIANPFVLPVRAAVSHVAIWEMALAAAITLASTYLVIRVAARVYTGAVLRKAPGSLLRDVMDAARATAGAK